MTDGQAVVDLLEKAERTHKTPNAGKWRQKIDAILAKSREGAEDPSYCSKCGGCTGGGAGSGIRYCYCDFADGESQVDEPMAEAMADAALLVGSRLREILCAPSACDDAVNASGPTLYVEHRMPNGGHTESIGIVIAFARADELGPLDLDDSCPVGQCVSRVFVSAPEERQ